MTASQTESNVNTFVSEECLLDDNAIVSQPELFSRWAAWCRRNDQGNPGDIASFSRELQTVAPSVVNVPLMLNAQIQYFGRIRLLDDAELRQRQLSTAAQ